MIGGLPFPERQIDLVSAHREDVFVRGKMKEWRKSSDAASLLELQPFDGNKSYTKAK